MDDTLYQLLAANTGQYDLLFTYQGQIVAAYLRDKCLDFMKTALEQAPSAQTLIRFLRPKCVAKELDHVTMLRNPWDLFTLNSDVIHSDFKFKNQPGIVKGDVHPFAAIYNENNVYVGQGSCIEDFVVINAKKGPVYIEENVVVEAGSYLEGPLYIGKGCQISGARIRNASIGQQCRIGGEVSSSVFFRYSNKGHYGFVGHSYVGEWVNLGAGTTTSNLKNTYGEVRKSGLQFFGSIISDHVKTGIGSLLNTGTVIGFGANIFGTGLHNKDIAAFSWGSPERYEVCQKEKFFEIAGRMMQRRQIDLREIEKELISSLYPIGANALS